MTALALFGADILAPQGRLADHALILDGGTIEAVVPVAEVAPGHDAARLDGGLLVAGFIDVQVNGGGGVLLNDDPSPRGMRAIAAAHARFGTTGLLPTLISDDPDKIDRILDALDEAIAAGTPGILGVHIEGPYLNPARRGIHDAGKIRALDASALERLTRPGAGRRIVTLAPELAPPGAIAGLSRAGVLVCAGHSLATYDQARAALDEGLAGFTHLFNAMTQLQSREPGMVGAALDDRRSLFGLIADGHHVHPAAMRIALAARGAEGVMLVTDAMPTVGSSVDHFRIGDDEIRLVEGALRGRDGTLGGSHLDMGQAFRNAIAMLGCSVERASRLASANPARFLGMEGLRGRLEAGLAADIVHLDRDLQVRRVWIAGEQVAPAA